MLTTRLPPSLTWSGRAGPAEIGILDIGEPVGQLGGLTADLHAAPRTASRSRSTTIGARPRERSSARRTFGFRLRADRQHLLLAAGEVAGLDSQPVSKLREQVQAPLPVCPGTQP